MSTILDYLSGSDDPESLTKAVDVIIQRRGTRRLQVVLSDELTCQACRTRLTEYAQAQDLAMPMTPELEEVGRHLMHCEECSAGYAALQTLSQAGEIDELTAIPVPEPDLSFLQPVPSVVSSLWRQVEAARRQLVADIEIAISRAAVQFQVLPGSLVPQPIPIPVLRDPTATGPAQRLTLPDPAGNLAFELTIGPLADHAQVALGVFRADSQQPVAQVAVTLLNAQRQRLRRVDTGPDGRAVFGDLPPGRYGVQIRTPDGQWELGLVLTES